MKRVMRKRFGGRKGFTLIEIIGVLAVISILAAILAPKVFEVIAESKSTRASAEIQVYSAAVARWYKDVGSLSPLTAGGAADAASSTTWHTQLTTSGGTLLGWISWSGPYLDGAPVASVGTSAAVYNTLEAGAAVANNNYSFDLNGDGNSNMTSTGRVVYLYLAGVSATDNNRIEAILDSGVPTGTSAAALGGRVKYDGTNMRIYLAHN